MKKYMIAGHVIAVRHASSEIEETLSLYRCDDALETERVFDISPEMISEERERWFSVYRDEIEHRLLYNQFCEWLAVQDGLYLHSSVVELDGYAYAFTAPSGTGKSTHANLWRQAFKGRAEILNDDKPLILRKDGQFYVCGSPWCGKEGIHQNRTVPLAAICFLEKGERNEIRRFSSTNVVALLLRQTILPEGEDEMNKLLDLVDHLIASVPIYLLRCNISEDAARLAHYTMRPKEKMGE